MILDLLQILANVFALSLSIAFMYRAKRYMKIANAAKRDALDARLKAADEMKEQEDDA